MGEVRLFEARAQKYHQDLERAEAQLERVMARVEAGVATAEEVNAAEQALADAEFQFREQEIRAEWLRARLEAARARTQKVSLDVKGAPLGEALKLIFEGTDQSFVLSPEVARNEVTITLKEVPLDLALDALCDLYNLDCTAEGNLWTLVPRNADVVTIGGRRVPVVGAVGVPGTPPDFETARSIVTRFSRPDLDAGAIQTRLLLSRLPYFDMLVDLEVENAPLSEVAKKLSVEKDGANRTEII
ncbi:MAG: hypothetical protein MUQ65_07330, partial [Armatimonadetes bacterium]|nr:hypothetical protein [Armatimonadota bacterium]